MVQIILPFYCIQFSSGNKDKTKHGELNKRYSLKIFLAYSMLRDDCKSVLSASVFTRT